MKVKTYKTIKIDEAIRSLDGSILQLTTRIGFEDITYQLPFDDLSIEDMMAVSKFEEGTDRLILRFTKSNEFVDLQTIPLAALNIFKPVLFDEIKVEPLHLVELDFNDQQFYIQKEGFSVIVAPTGSGKTYNVIKNLKTLTRNFDVVLYLNLEITDNDVKMRTQKIYGPNIEFENLFLATTTSMKDITSFVGNKSACVIIDNIDNFIGGGINAFDIQNKFVNEFDRWAKEKGNLGIFLSQFVKEAGRETILKENKATKIKEIDPAITYNQLSGVAQISRLSRSVVMVYYDYDENISYFRVLKKGSGKFANELTPEDELQCLR